MFCYTKNKLATVRGKIVFIGDSISDIGNYISYINTYLRITNNHDVELINLGLSSETVSGLSEPSHPFPRPCIHNRIDNILRVTNPDWVVVSYGINDGIYFPYSDERSNAYKKGITTLVDKIHSVGAKAVVMTPLVYDSQSADCEFGEANDPDLSFMRPYKNYDEVMEKYSRWIISEMSGYADVVIDIRTPFLNDTLTRRQQDSTYRSGDGIHPNLHGHWIIAKSILNTLFGVETNRLEDMLDRDNNILFEMVYQYDQLRHFQIKEFVGHDNPYKNELPDNWEEKEKQLEIAIDNYLHENNNLTKFQSEWNGFSTEEFFSKEGYEVIIAKPNICAEGNPWVWRTEFFGAFPAVDLELLRRGWHVIQLRIPNLYGASLALRIMSEFQTNIHISIHIQLSPTPVLFGFSRGALYAQNYASMYPHRIAMLYLDAPVVDIRSWPEGLYNGAGDLEDWKKCQLAYGMNHDEDSRMISVAKNLINAKIPLIIVAGDKDKIVPYDENGAFLAKHYSQSNVPFKLIIKPNIGHHPHSLENPEEIVDFIENQINLK